MLALARAGSALLFLIGLVFVEAGFIYMVIPAVGLGLIFMICGGGWFALNS